jgi:hypothetical protein
MRLAVASPLPQYISYVIVGSAPARIWEQPSWQRAIGVLAPVLDQSCDVGVRVSELDRVTRREPKLGKLGWNEESHRRWPLATRGETRDFLRAEVWVPRWTVCQKERRDPTVFVAIDNPCTAYEARQGHYNQLVHLAFEAAWHHRAADAIANAIVGVHGIVAGVAVFVGKSAWNEGGDSVQDALNNRFRYSGMHEDAIPNAAKLAQNGWLPHRPGTQVPTLESLPKTRGFFEGLTLGGAHAPKEDATPASPSRDPVVYDKAKYHYGGDYPEDLPHDQAFVHTGMYLGWIIDRGLYSDEFAAESASEIESFRKRRMTGRQVYERWDGALVDDMLSAEGNAFSAAYFDFEHGQFLADYRDVLARDLPSEYHVEDSWPNYERLKARIDERYRAWKATPRRV